MSLLNALSALAGGGKGGGALVPVLLEQLKQYPGGFAGLIADFQKGGLGDIIASWIGKGANQAVSPSQLGSVLNGNVLEAIASGTGQSRDSILGTLSKLLPDLVDKATPDGDTANPRFDTGSLLTALPGLLGKLG